MRHLHPFVWTLGITLGFAAAVGAADRPQLELKDGGFPLQELRGLDRRVYVLILEGTWNQPPIPGVTYYVNVFFPNGQGYANRPVNDPGLRPGDEKRLVHDAKGNWVQASEMSPFRQGEVRVYLKAHEFICNGLANGGPVTVVISARKEAASPTAPEVVSAPYAFTWPLNKAIVTRAPKTRFTPAEPPDALPLPGEPLPVPKPEPKKAEGSPGIRELN